MNKPSTLASLRHRWNNFFFAPTLPDNLGLCRILFYGIFFPFYFRQDISSWATVPSVFWAPVGIFKLFHIPIFSEKTLFLLQLIWKASLLLSCLGLFTRFHTFVAFITGTYLLGLPHNFGKIHHFDAIVVFCLGILALSQCGNKFSLDHWFYNRQWFATTKPAMKKTSGEYTWPIQTIRVMLSLIFFTAGVSKIRGGGIEWIWSDNLQILLIQHFYHISANDPLVTWGLYVAKYSILCRLLAASTVLLEFGYPLALFNRYARWIFVPGMILLLIGFRLTLGPSFYQLIFCSLFWVRWDSIWAWAKHTIRYYRKSTSYHLPISLIKQK